MGKLPIGPIAKYYRDAQTIYSAHSPFVFDFMKNVMGASSGLSEEIIAIEDQRKILLDSKSSITFQDYGAGSLAGNNNQNRMVSHIAKHSLSGKWQCRLLFNIVKQYGIGEILEMGTSLGISTSYLAKANEHGKVVTLEGNPSSVEVAREVWLKASVL